MTKEEARALLVHIDARFTELRVDIGRLVDTHERFVEQCEQRREAIHQRISSTASEAAAEREKIEGRVNKWTWVLVAGAAFIGALLGNIDSIGTALKAIGGL